MFTKTLDNKRYHTLNYYYRTKFKSTVIKVSLNGNFSCPNYKDGGCIFCSGGSGNSYLNLSLEEQFRLVKVPLDKKWPKAKYIAYLQANTNTYAPVEVLKKKYAEALAIPGVIGLSIATRCDALSDEVLELLSELNKKTYLTVEVGLQTIHEETLKFIRRGHDLKSFDEAIKKLKDRGIFTVVHIINGLPYETKEMMIDTVKHLNDLEIEILKQIGLFE